MIGRYSNLGLTCLTPAMRARTCGYWYTVACAATPHTAFRTRAALMFWLDKRGLRLTDELPPEGTHGYQKLNGEFISKMHGAPENMPLKFHGEPFLHMSNGDYTEARLTHENGVHVVNYLNPNANRPVWHYSVGRSWEDAGKDGLPPMRSLT